MKFDFIFSKQNQLPNPYEQQYNSNQMYSMMPHQPVVNIQQPYQQQLQGSVSGTNLAASTYSTMQMPQQQQQQTVYMNKQNHYNMNGFGMHFITVNLGAEWGELCSELKEIFSRLSHGFNKLV